MVEWHKVKLDIRDRGSNGAAEFYKDMSDVIWAQGARSGVQAATIRARVEPVEARDILNEVLREIDEAFVVMGSAKAVKLRGAWPRQQAELSAHVLDEPVGAMVGTHNWDESRGKVRHVSVDGQGVAAAFTDGHIDYHRDIFATFLLRREEGWSSTIEYSIPRNQAQQGGDSSLYLRARHPSLAESGYDGSLLHGSHLENEEEVRLLDAIRRIGDIAVEAQDFSFL